MRILLLSLAAALCATTATAEPIDTNSIVAAVTGDWNGDGALDLAFLTRGEDDMDLHFFLQDKTGLYLRDAGVVRGKVWGTAQPDGISGQQPTITAPANGSIQITTRNDAIGRDRWTQTLTLAYRNSDFVVAGFTYSYYDTLVPDSSGDCDLNVLTGKGVASKGGTTTLKISAKAEFIPFKDWSDEVGMTACGISE